MSESTSSCELSPKNSVADLSSRDDHAADSPPSTSSPAVPNIGLATADETPLDDSHQSSQSLDHARPTTPDQHRRLTTSNDEQTITTADDRTQQELPRPVGSPGDLSSATQPLHSSPRSSSPTHPRPSSPYVMIEGTRHPVLNTSSFESTGLMYAHNLVLVDSDEMNTESATDVLSGTDQHYDDGDSFSSYEPTSAATAVSQQSLVLTEEYSDTSPPVDLSVLMDLEVLSNKLGSELDTMMHGLRTSLHAMTVCTHQGISLQRETAENVQQSVDTNVKAMYTFLSKFSELHRNLKPVNDISRQIHEVNDRLKTLEKLF